MNLHPTDRRILVLALPALGTLVIEPLYVLTDTAIVGHLGTVPLGGLALASTVLNTLLWAFNFLATGTTTRVAFHLGAGRRESAAEAAVNALWLAAFLGMVVGAGLLLAAPTLARVLGGRGPVLDAAVTYLRISALGVPTILITYAGIGHLRGRADTRSPLVVIGLANVVNLALEVVLVYGLDLGIAGSAWGTVVAQTMAAVAFVAMVVRQVAPDRPRRRPDIREALRLLVVARQLFIRTGALLAALAIATAVAARMNPAALGAHQIAMQVSLFLALALDSVAIAVQTLVATALGAGDERGARDLAWRALRLSLRSGVAVAVVLAAAAGLIPRLFSTDAVVIDAAHVALLVLSFEELPASVAFALDGVLAGADDFGFLQWAMLAALAVFGPVAFVVHTTDAGVGWLWAGLAAWMTTRAGFSVWRVRGSAWSAPRPTARPRPAPARIARER